MQQGTQNLAPATLAIFQTALDNYYNKERQSGLQGTYRNVEVEKEVTQNYALGDVPGAKDWRGPRSFQRFEKYSFSITSKPITGGEIEFDRIMDIGQNAVHIQDSMARSIRVVGREPEKRVLDALVSGNTTKAYDGDTFFLSTTAERGYANLHTATGQTEDDLKNDIDSVEELMGKVESNTGNDLEITSNTILAPTALFNKFRRITESTADTSDNKNSNVINIYNGWRAVKVPGLTGNSWYVVASDGGEEIYPVIWQTTTVQGQRIILDVVDSLVGIAGTVMFAASMYGGVSLAHPFAAFKVQA